MPIFEINEFRKARLSAKMTQAQAAEKIGVDPITIIQWEKGSNKPTKKNLEKMAKAYRCTIDELLGSSPAGRYAGQCIKEPHQIPQTPDGAQRTETIKTQPLPPLYRPEAQKSRRKTMENAKFEIPQWALSTAIEGLKELASRLEDDAAAFAKVDTPEGRRMTQECLEKAWEYRQAHEFFLKL